MRAAKLRRILQASSPLFCAQIYFAPAFSNKREQTTYPLAFVIGDFKDKSE
jgi:hypothetical protein